MSLEWRRVKLDDWAISPIGAYKIRRVSHGNFTLSYKETIIGILSDRIALRRLAEIDYKQRTGAANGQE